MRAVKCKSIVLVLLTITAPGQAVFPAFHQITIAAARNDEQPSWDLDGTKAILHGVTVRDMMTRGYELRTAPLYLIEGLPAWAESNRYNIDASKEYETGDSFQQRLFVLSILFDHFGLKIHGATKERPIYELAISSDVVSEMNALSTMIATGAAVPTKFVEVNPATPRNPRIDGVIREVAGRNQLTESAGTISGLIAGIQSRVDLPIVDRTGLKGVYQYTLEWASDSELSQALQDQLSLKVERGKGSVQVIVVDEIHEPLK